MNNKNLSLMLIVFGIVEIILPLLNLIFVLPQLNKLDNSLGTNAFNPALSFGFFIFVTVFGIIQIIRGVFFKKSNEKTSKILLTAGGILGALTIPAIIVFTINPIYKILAS